jgi:hypothetical protein
MLSEARGSEATEAESKHPEHVSSAMQHQGVLLRMRRAQHFRAMRDSSYYTFWVYITGSRTGTLYTGMTGFFDRRIGQHKTGAIDGFTKKYALSPAPLLRRVRRHGHSQTPRTTNKRLAAGEEKSR